MKKLSSVLLILLISIICLLCMGVAFAKANDTSISLNSPLSSQNYEPGDNIQITGTAQNITKITILVRNALDGMVYAAESSVVDSAFSTDFRLNDDAVEGQYTIFISAAELSEPVNFTFKVSKSDSGDSSSSGGGGGGGSKSNAVTSTTGTATVKPGAGGTISLGSEATIKIPANALAGTSKVKVKVQKVTDPPPVPDGFKFASNVYEFSVGGDNNYTFAKNVTVTLSFDPQSAGQDKTPAIYYYEESQDEWIKLGGTVSDSAITIQVDHFTKFAVLTVKKNANNVDNANTETTTASLKDVAGHWAYDNISKLVAMGNISGYPDGSFKPDKSITRAEFATVLVSAFKLTSSKSGKTFTDTAGHWAGDSIAIAFANGIVGGYDADSFGPDDLITREQMAAMIVKTAKLAPSTEEAQFADSSSISSWAKETMTTATDQGIINGYPDNTVRPKAGATRAEAVTVIVNALNK